MKLAIVGSTAFDGDAAAEAWASSLINAYLDSFVADIELVISGGAKGIDTLGVGIARDRGINTLEYLPENKRWAPNGYKERNLLIAQNCDVLLRISHHASKTYGSGWTADRAEELGKSVHRYYYSV